MNSSLVDRVEAARAEPTAAELRQRLRGVATHLTRDRFANRDDLPILIRKILFVAIDRSPDDALFAMRDAMRKLLE